MIDLHSHSTCSDGSESPQRVVELAAEAGCRTIALTDHDGLDGVLVARERAAELGVEFIPGCEVSCTSRAGSMHVLCYFIEPDRGALQDELGLLRRDREERNLKLVDRLNALGLPISYEEIVAEAGNATIGRPHFAAVLVRHGHTATMAEAFDRYLAEGRPGYIDKERVSPREIAEKATESGGVAVLAHPLTLGLDPKDLEDMVAELEADGLSGLECYYSSYDPATRSDLVALARRHHLVPTGGSDFHGTYKPGLRVGVGNGDLLVPDEILDELAARRP